MTWNDHARYHGQGYGLRKLENCIRSDCSRATCVSALARAMILVDGRKLTPTGL